MLDRHQDRASPFAADPDALREAQHHEHDRRRGSHGVVGREQADQERGHSHDHERVDQHRFAPDAVAEVAEDHSADGSRHKTDGKCAEGRERACERVDVREEELVENQGRRRAVEEEVVPLDGRPDEARQDDLPERFRVGPLCNALHGEPRSYVGALTAVKRNRLIMRV